MGEFTFENQTLGTFLVYHLSEQEHLDQLALGMLTHNRIPGILPVNCMQVDAERIVRFRVSSLTALMGYWGGSTGRQKLLTFLTSFCKAILECREYMLDPSHILLAWDQVFVEPLSGEARLAYLPVMDGATDQPTPEAFLRELLQHTTFAPDEDSSHIPVLLNAVNTPNFSVEGLYAQLKDLVAEPKRDAARPPVQPLRPARPVPQPVRPVQPVPQPVSPAPANGSEGEKKKGLLGFGGKLEKQAGKKGSEKADRPAAGPAFSAPGMSGGENAAPAQPVREKKGLFGKKQGSVQPIQSVEPVRPIQPVQPVRQIQPVRAMPNAQPARGGGETVALSDDSAARTVSFEDTGAEHQPEAVSGKLSLVRRLTGQKVAIDKPIFHVGRESRIVDFCITGGHNWVGTDHAYFLRKPDGIYLVDNNSLNHTWLNGQQLVGNQPYLVRQGDVIKMADEEFDVLPG